MENFLASNVDFFKFFLSNHQDAIYIQNILTQQISWANAKFCELHSIELEDVINKEIQSEILEESVLLATTIKDKETRSVDLKIENQDQNLFIRLTINKFKDKYIIGSIRDISEFINLHQALESTEDRLENILQLINIGLAFIDIEGFIFLANKAFADTIGHPSTKSLISQPFGELILSEMKPEIVSYLTKLTQEKNLLFQVQIQCIDSTYKDVLISLGSLLSADGNRWGSMVILIDISDRIEFEKFRNRFIEITTHELRTPLTIIKGSNELISQYYFLENDLVKELLNTISRNVDRLQKLIDSVQDVGKIERGIFEISRERISFKDFKKNILQDLRVWVYADRVIHNFTQPPFSHEKENLIFVDVDRLSQAVFNVLENACKYTSNEVKLNVTWKTTGLHLVIMDFGKGIPNEILESRLKAFSSKISHQNTGGLGLGLYIVKYIIKQHQGDLNISSNNGKGTKIEIFIPNN